MPGNLVLGARCDLSVSFQIKHKGLDSWGLWLYNYPHTVGTSCCLWASSIWLGLGVIAGSGQPFGGRGRLPQHSIKDLQSERQASPSISFLGSSEVLLLLWQLRKRQAPCHRQKPQRQLTLASGADVRLSLQYAFLPMILQVWVQVSALWE